MIKAYVGDITRLNNVEYICNAANGIGPMGSGIAGAIRRAGGTSIQQEAFMVCKNNNYQPGSIYITNSGTLPYKKILHLVTMKNPGGDTSLDIVEMCLINLLKFCESKSISKVALTALGTGVGGLNYKDVANIFVKILANSNIEFDVVDINNSFINYINTELFEIGKKV